jgi:hypothetical protein
MFEASLGYIGDPFSKTKPKDPRIFTILAMKVFKNVEFINSSKN